jgi:hypothetical protein
LTKGYSVAVAGLKPTKEIIERECMDPTFIPNYYPKNIKEAEEVNISKKHYDIKPDCPQRPIKLKRIMIIQV